MSTNTPIDFAKIVPTKLSSLRQDVVKLHYNSRNAADQAIAHCTILGLSCFGTFASSASKAWMKDEIEKHNQDVKTHNDAVKADKKRARDYYNLGTLPPGDTLLLRHNHPDRQKEQEEQKAALLAEGAKDDEYWNLKERRPAAITREDANLLIPAVRYAFDFDKQDDDEAVSGTARVVEYLVNEFKDATAASVDDIVKRIKELGGKSAVLRLARGQKKNSDKPDTADEIDEMMTAYRGVLNQAMRSVKAKASAQFNLPGNNVGELVLVVGRQDANDTAILASMSIDNALLRSVSPLLRNVVQIPVAPGIDFLSRMLAFSPLIEEGKDSAHKVNDLTAERAIKERRVLVVHRDATDQLHFMLTAQFASASALVKVTPKVELKLNFSGPAQFVPGEQFAGLITWLGDDVSRTLISLSSETTNGQFALSLTHATKKDEKKKPVVKTATFTPVKAEAVKPLDAVVEFADYKMTLTRDDAQAFFDVELASWKDKASGGAAAEVTFDAAGLAYKFSTATPYHVAGQNASGDKIMLTLRSFDLCNAFEGLLALPCTAFNLEVDQNGLLKIACDDGLAAYEVFIPEADKRNNLLSSCIRKLRIAA